MYDAAYKLPASQISFNHVPVYIYNVIIGLTNWNSLKTYAKPLDVVYALKSGGRRITYIQHFYSRVITALAKWISFHNRKAHHQQLLL